MVLKVYYHPTRMFFLVPEKLIFWRYKVSPWWPQQYLDELLSDSSGLDSGVEMYTGSPS